MKKIQLSIIIFILINSTYIGASSLQKEFNDFDPLLDIEVTVVIETIRALEKIDSNSDPDFFCKVFINDVEFVSPIWNDTSYNYDMQWEATLNVPDDQEYAKIKIQLWDWNEEGDIECDIGDENNYVNINYSIKTGHWSGGDSINDSSGYRRLNGCDDKSYYQNQRDCEIWFDIYQNDFDGDGIPYYVETNIYGTDPEVKNILDDSDHDNIPIEWEYQWGFDPFLWDDFENLDPDRDSINNFEEYLTTNFGSDPFRRDLFLEIDYMQEGPNGELSIVPEDALELIKKPYHRRNIVLHVDTGIECGGEVIPFDEDTNQNEVTDIYNNYFLHNNKSNWRRGVFHYGVFVYLCQPNGYAFKGDGSPFWGYGPGTNSFVIASKNMYRLAEKTQKSVSYIYASSVVHEMGHNFGIRWGHPFGCDGRFTIKPWQIGFWLFNNYKSIMNYRYTYSILDYSDGSHGIFDFNDWTNIDLSYFEV